MINEIDIAWAAGIFEGEGTFCLIGDHQPKAAIGMSDRDVVERFHKIVGLGNICLDNRDKRSTSYKTIHRWQNQNRIDFLHFGVLISPYLGKRRKEKLIEIISTMRIRKKLLDEDIRVAALEVIQENG